MFPASRDISKSIGVLPTIHAYPQMAPADRQRRTEFVDIIAASLDINTPEQFCTWLQNDFQEIFPHGMMACAIGEVEEVGSNVHHIVAHNFPLEYIQSLQQASGLISSPIIAKWLNTRKPVLFELPEQHENHAWLANFKRYGLQNVASHGLIDIQNKMGSYFSFSKIPGKLTTQHAKLLEILVPHLHVALCRALKNCQTPAVPPVPLSVLTEREQEIWHWLGQGKTNWEIAKVLHLSESTVKNHVQRILIKLKVNNRAQAVRKGLLPQ